MSERAWDRTRQAFEDAGSWFVQTASSAGDRWDEPALGVWTVRDLVGHTSRAFLTVEAYLDAAASVAEIPSPGDYFVRALASLGDPEQVAARGRAAGAALGEPVPSAVSVIAERVLGRVRAAGPEDLVGTPVGGMRLADYLPTRTFELTVHTCDLAAALGLPLDVPAAAAEASLSLLSDLAVHSGRAGALLRAATGREGLPPGFTVLAP